MAIGTIVLIALVLILLLLVVLGLVVVVLSDRVERGITIAIAVAGGLSLLICVGVVAGLIWLFGSAVVAPAPPPVYVTSPPMYPVVTLPPPIPPATVSLVPESATISQGESITITIVITNVTDLYGLEVHLAYDGGLSIGNLTPGTCANDVIIRPQSGDGRIDFAAARMTPNLPLSGDCDVATFILTGETPIIHAVIAFDNVILAGPDGVALPVTTRDGEVAVIAPAP